MVFIGVKRMYVTGVVGTGLVSIIYGTIEWMPQGYVAIFASFTLRAAEAFFAAPAMVGVMTLVSLTFPQKRSSIAGISGAAQSIGMLLGPSIGSFLYARGGFHLPFFVTGTMYTLIGLVMMPLLPSPSRSPEISQKSDLTRKMLCNSIVMILCSSLAVIYSAIGYLSSTLAIHLKSSLGMNEYEIGFTFLIAPGIIAIGSPMLGRYSDKRKNGLNILLYGGLSHVVGFLLLVPWNMNISTNYRIFIALTLLGFGLSSLVVIMQVMTETVGLPPDDIQSQTSIAAFVNTSRFIGEFFGMSGGGILIDNFSFTTGCYAMAASNLVCVVLMAAMRKITV
ncbi:DgyrCDS332 [Dimorphilus gyrociliatus]|uniref:DgyrCDS332 n=1 Tax=Dimorphilus gyrociliatus TaxID=2664684 RepID=A0A7I8V5H7_9ANNE|nr:DgyrCDS332 [Dimorphilus gyrociliatus]